VHLTVQTFTDVLSLPTPYPLRWVVAALSYGWMAGLVVLAIFASRRREPAGPAVEAHAAGRRAGWVTSAIAAAGVVLQLVWIGQHVDQLRPLMAGSSAPALDLPAIGANGTLEGHVAMKPGRITIIDFWATWCGPCLHAMPKLDAFARQHPEVDVIAINLDDAAEARGIWDQARYVITLLADDGATSERYGVTAIPHTVVIDRQGVLRKVGHGGGIDFDAEVKALAR
jgi:thiol-disulfide isomerase/thioredoxin